MKPFHDLSDTLAELVEQPGMDRFLALFDKWGTGMRGADRRVVWIELKGWRCMEPWDLGRLVASASTSPSHPGKVTVLLELVAVEPLHGGYHGQVELHATATPAEIARWLVVWQDRILPRWLPTGDIGQAVRARHDAMLADLDAGTAELLARLGGGTWGDA